MKRCGARVVSPLLVGVCVCAGLGAATTHSAQAAESICEYTEGSTQPLGFAVGLPRGSSPNGSAGDPGRVAVHTKTGPQWPEVAVGDREISRVSLGEEHQDGDRFGAAVVRVELDGDGCLDLVVGAPGVDGGGAVYVIFGTRAGPGTGPSIRIPLPARRGDAFGNALAVVPASPVTSRPSGQIWIGAPGRDVSGQANAGAVGYVEVVDRVASTPRLYTQNSPGVPGKAEPGDRFGERLAPIWSFKVGDGVLVGQPSEDLAGAKDAGMVTVLPAPSASPAGPGPYGVTEDTPGIPGAVEAGDRFGEAVDVFRDVAWVGVPDEDLGAVRDVGMVHGLDIGATTLTSHVYLRQGQDKGETIPGRPEAGDHFGASVRGGFPWYPDGGCEAQAIIGVPDEDVGTIRNAGEVDLHFGRECRSGAAFNLRADAHPGDRLGAAVARMPDYDDGTTPDGPDHVLVGVPGYDAATAVDGGVVIEGRCPGCSSRQPGGRPSTVHTHVSGVGSGARYGAVLNR